MKAGSSPAVAARSEHGAKALRDLLVAIEQHARGATDIEDLRAAVEEFSANARDERQLPEQLLVALKEALERLPVGAREPPGDQKKIKERIVSLAIQTYFGDGATP
jgi:hypothetical protein